MGVTGNLKAEDALLISPPPCSLDVSRRPPREQLAELCFDCSWFMRSGVVSVPPLRKQAPREPPVRRFRRASSALVCRNQNVILKEKLLSFLQVWLSALPAVPPLRWQDEPVSQTPLAGVGVGVRG